MSDPADNQRLIGDIVREGTVDSVDLGARTCRFRTGDVVTGDIPWLATRSGATKTWSPPSIGEQGLLICPEGDTARGVVLPGIFSNDHPAPSSEDIELVEYADGARISYDATAHELKAILPAGATVTISADGGLSIKGDVALDGNLSVTGTIDADGEITGNGIKLSAHKHPGVQAGGARTGTPE
ncbi:phage baseplate assembly protein V [Sphingomonas sp. QA11]|uniref:phage baseplate assembly protein V n=1 Tax=Sphingomonas sp. QA11 TaxID=2950605 RepID=UPI002349AB59|nr:phage baseplate assembly protein V [Sphingomonas sp. QA11]WCM29200.1 phage baseplate assembly protein V [Sphingomonas sp. QA11]